MGYECKVIKTNNGQLNIGAKWVVGGVAGEKEVEDFYKSIEKLDKHNFDEYIVGYIDFLGVKDKIKNEKSFESLQILKFLLSGTSNTATYISGINSINDFDIKVFSDNIVIAQKIDKEKLGDQIVSIVNVISSMQFQALLQFDFWLRGGITIGELYIDNTIVWGSGLVDAYNIENNLANYPRVILSNKLLLEYEKCKNGTLNLYALIKKDVDGLWFVDFILAVPNIKMIPEISKFLSEKVKKYLNAPDRVKQKINWMITYFNDYCNKFRQRGNYEQYMLEDI